MSDPQSTPETCDALPHAKARRKKWKFPFVWVVPIIAGLVAGYLVYQRAYEFGPELTIQFKDVTGVKPGQTQIKYRGVPVGQVTDIDLSHDVQYALVKARLKRSVARLAREGSVFWIVRPEVGLADISGLGTIITGPHIELLPAGDKPQLEFVGLEKSPATRHQKGLRLRLLSAERGSLKTGSPVYYRGMEVGTVRDCQLSTNAVGVDIDVFIEQRYTNLVRGDSKFWNVSGVDVKFGLFRGAEINVESLRSLAAGGIAFATPTQTKEGPVADGAVFRLYEEQKPEWKDWIPEIPIPEEE